MAEACSSQSTSFSGYHQKQDELLNFITNLAITSKLNTKCMQFVSAAKYCRSVPYVLEASLGKLTPMQQSKNNNLIHRELHFQLVSCVGKDHCFCHQLKSDEHTLSQQIK